MQEQARNAISETDHLAAESAIQFFSYNCPVEFQRSKTAVKLVRGKFVRSMVQVVKSGGENNLHFHDNAGGFWMVLKGRAKFYGPGDKLLREVGPMEGLVIPRYARYWFESEGDEVLEILLVQALVDGENQSSGRTDSAAPKFNDAGRAPEFDAAVRS